MKEKAIQYLSDEYLQACKKLSAKEILQFLENFRLIHGDKVSQGKSKLISIKIPENLLLAFKARAKLEGVPYQSLIKRLMIEWLEIN